MGGQGAKFLVMTLCQVLFCTYFHMQKMKTWGQGGHGPRGPLDPLLRRSRKSDWFDSGRRVRASAPITAQFLNRFDSKLVC